MNNMTHFLKSNLLTRHKKHVETGMSPNFDNDPYIISLIKLLSHTQHNNTIAVSMGFPLSLFYY
jgi:hypothetical protein